MSEKCKRPEWHEGECGEVTKDDLADIGEYPQDVDDPIKDPHRP